MQEPLIQKILKLTKYTFARDLNAKHGVRQQILGPEKFSNHLAEISSLMKQVCNISLFWDQTSALIMIFIISSKIYYTTVDSFR